MEETKDGSPKFELKKKPTNNEENVVQSVSSDSPTRGERKKNCTVVPKVVLIMNKFKQINREIWQCTHFKFF